MKKYSKAQKIAKVGRYGQTFDTIYHKISDSMNINKLTSKQIACIIDIMYAQKVYGSDEMYKELSK